MVLVPSVSLSADLSEKRIREEVISPAKLVAIDVEGDGRSGCLTREARGVWWCSVSFLGAVGSAESRV